MTKSLRVVPILLISLVVTQIIYVVLSGNGADINRAVLWSTEAVAFLAITVLALTALAHRTALAMAWAAIAISGILNIVQLGIGLTMFGPLSDAGEALAPAYKAIVAGAFFFYFAGKLLFGFAAIIVGASLLRAGGVARFIGALAALAGLSAMVVNLGGMATGMALAFPAGATGTAATLLLAIALAIKLRGSQEALQPQPPMT